jgi:hypothetical protein
MKRLLLAAMAIFVVSTTGAFACAEHAKKSHARKGSNQNSKQAVTSIESSKEANAEVDRSNQNTKDQFRRELRDTVRKGAR